MPEPNTPATGRDGEPSNGHAAGNGNGHAPTDKRRDDIDVDETAYKSTKVDKLLDSKLSQLDVLEQRLGAHDLPDVPPAMKSDALDDLEMRHQKRAGIKPEPKDGAGKPGNLQSYMRYSHLAVLFAVIFGVCMVIGYLIDENAGTEPAGLLIGSAVGFVAATITIYRELAKHEKM